jgi:hypothetical protein
MPLKRGANRTEFKLLPKDRRLTGTHVGHVSSNIVLSHHDAPVADTIQIRTSAILHMAQWQFWLHLAFLLASMPYPLSLVNCKDHER